MSRLQLHFDYASRNRGWEGCGERRGATMQTWTSYTTVLRGRHWNTLCMQRIVPVEMYRRIRRKVYTHTYIFWDIFAKSSYCFSNDSHKATGARDRTHRYSTLYCPPPSSSIKNTRPVLSGWKNCMRQKPRRSGLRCTWNNSLFGDRWVYTFRELLIEFFRLSELLFELPGFGVFPSYGTSSSLNFEKKREGKKESNTNTTAMQC